MVIGHQIVHDVGFSDLFDFIADVLIVRTREGLWIWGLSHCLVCFGVKVIDCDFAGVGTAGHEELWSGSHILRN